VVDYIGVGVGQLWCAISEIVSQFPISGGPYPWARRLVGNRGVDGRVDIWLALCCTMAGRRERCRSVSRAVVRARSSDCDDRDRLILIVMTTALNLAARAGWPDSQCSASSASWWADRVGIYLCCCAPSSR